MDPPPPKGPYLCVVSVLRPLAVVVHEVQCVAAQYQAGFVPQPDSMFFVIFVINHLARVEKKTE